MIIAWSSFCEVLDTSSLTGLSESSYSAITSLWLIILAVASSMLLNDSKLFGDKKKLDYIETRLEYNII